MNSQPKDTGGHRITFVDGSGVQSYVTPEDFPYGHPSYPPALAKACCDPFEYLLGLRNGMVIHFHAATEIDGDWVHVELGDCGVDFGRYPCPRGIDVRVADIVWIA